MAVADVKAAIIEEMLTIDDITDLADDRIGSVHRRSWGIEPGYMILVRLNGSPGEADWRPVGFQATRLDMEFYGATPDAANELWQAAHPTLCPVQGQARLKGFTRAGCRVVGIDKEAGPFEVIDQITKLPFTFASYVAVWAEIPVS